MLKMLRCDKGTGFIEFAITLPLLVTLVVGLIEVGRYTAFSVRVSNAAHAGAQFAQSQGERTAYDSTDIFNAACQDSGFTCASTASNNVMVISSTVVCKFSDGTADASCALPTSSTVQRLMYSQVTTSATFTPLLNYPLFGNNVPVSATTVMQVDQGQ